MIQIQTSKNNIDAYYYLQRNQKLNKSGEIKLLDDDSVEKTINNIIDNDEYSSSKKVELLFANQGIATKLKTWGIKSSSYFYKARDEAKLDAIRCLTNNETPKTYFTNGIIEKQDTLNNKNTTANKCIRKNFTNSEIKNYKQQAKYFYSLYINSHIKAFEHSEKLLLKIKNFNKFCNNSMRHWCSEDNVTKRSYNYGEKKNADLSVFLADAYQEAEKIFQGMDEKIGNLEKTEFIKTFVEATMWINVHRNRGQFLKMMVINPIKSIMACIFFISLVENIMQEWFIVLFCATARFIYSIVFAHDGLYTLPRQVALEMADSRRRWINGFNTIMVGFFNTGDKLGSYTNTYNASSII